VLRAERIMHLALKRDIRRSFSREDGKRRPVHYLTPDVLALWNWIEDPVPTAARIEGRHVQHQHWIMPTPARAKPVSRSFDLGCFEGCCVHLFFLSVIQNEHA
jgi:hypothetical protein